MVTVTFLVNGAEVAICAAEGDSLMDAARRANVALDAPCSGNGACGKCRVRLVAGKLDAPASRHISEAEYAAGWRLACRSRLTGDVTVEVPDIASAYRSRLKIADLSSPKERAIFEGIRREIAEAGIELTNDLSSVTVSPEEPTMDDAMPDNERLARKLRKVLGAERVVISYAALKRLARTLRQGAFRARCVVETGEVVTVLDALPADNDAPVAGLAIDLGTTSVAALLVNMENGEVLSKASAGNGQIRYGADVINRIIESERDGGVERLQRAVTEETLRPLIARMCAEAGISAENIYRVCVAGNTTMNHLLLGLYANPIRVEPYVPSFFKTDALRANDLGLNVHPEAKLLIAPNVGSYVGGDITAGTFASMLWNREALSLLIDLGTNGELVFGNHEFLMCCACSAGPAFEGGDISCGMRAADGAIDSCAIDAETMEPAFTTVGSTGRPVGICGSGIIDIVAELFRAGIIDGRGRFVRRGRRVRFDEHGMGSYVVAAKEETGGLRDVEINEADIDSFIRAKGAVFSAIMTMLDAAGMQPDALEHVYVAGGIGSGINMKNAVAVGMLPDIDPERFSYIGNAALSGAYAMLTGTKAAEKIDELAGSMTYLELSAEPGYMDAFVAACFLPHTDENLFPSARR